MTYDQWKTTDPREYEREPEEDQPTELDAVNCRDRTGDERVREAAMTEPCSPVTDTSRPQDAPPDDFVERAVLDQEVGQLKAEITRLRNENSQLACAAHAQQPASPETGTIIERLRNWPATAPRKDAFSSHFVGALLNEAADELERLAGNAQQLGSLMTKQIDDPADLWESYCAEVNAEDRSPQGAMAFAYDFFQSSPAQSRAKIIEECAKVIELSDLWDNNGEIAKAVRALVPLSSTEVPAAQQQDAEDIRWQRVNDEPFEYAIEKGPNGDEFVRLRKGNCLRRPISGAVECAAHSAAPRSTPA
jgi:hypothetical protein